MIAIDGDRLRPRCRGRRAPLALSAADGAMRDAFRGLAEADGFPVTVDAAGSMFVRLNDPEALPPVLVGSHLGTQVAGGRFDGIPRPTK